MNICHKLSSFLRLGARTLHVFLSMWHHHQLVRFSLPTRLKYLIHHTSHSTPTDIPIAVWHDIRLCDMGRDNTHTFTRTHADSHSHHTRTLHTHIHSCHRSTLCRWTRWSQGLWFGFGVWSRCVRTTCLSSFFPLAFFHSTSLSIFKLHCPTYQPCAHLSLSLFRFLHPSPPHRTHLIPSSTLMCTR